MRYEDLVRRAKSRATAEDDTGMVFALLAIADRLDAIHKQWQEPTVDDDT